MATPAATLPPLVPRLRQALRVSDAMTIDALKIKAKVGALFLFDAG